MAHRRDAADAGIAGGLGDIDAKALATFPIGDPDEGIDLRVGKYGRDFAETEVVTGGNHQE